MPVADRTGLGGRYDFQLEFAPQPPGALPPANPEAPPEADDSAPNLMTAVQRLGLKLNPEKVNVDMVVVERANPVPIQN